MCVRMHAYMHVRVYVSISLSPLSLSLSLSLSSLSLSLSLYIHTHTDTQIDRIWLSGTVHKPEARSFGPTVIYLYCLIWNFHVFDLLGLVNGIDT